MPEQGFSGHSMLGGEVYRPLGVFDPTTVLPAPLRALAEMLK